MSERIGFVSTRFAGTDGVSLESAKWAHVLWDFDCKSFWYGGLLDRDPESSHCVPEAHFEHSENLWLNERIWGEHQRTPVVSRRIHEMAAYLKTTLYDFVERYDISVLVAQNALTIPMNLPLGVALTEFITETRIPAIAHHHDFYWERTRFSVNSVSDYLDFAFPPRQSGIQHVVINEGAQEELAWRKGVSSTLIPNVFDFEGAPPEPDEYTKDLRAELGFADDDIILLQPTRIVPRKGIEHSIKLLEALKEPNAKLVISHAAGDEGYESRNMLVNFVTYPSLYEGFGNAFLEAMFFRLPILINRYAIFARDIEPKGFSLPLMDGYLTRQVVDEVRRLLEDDEYRRQTVDHNYAVAKRFFSYALLRRRLRTLITNVSGVENND